MPEPKSARPPRRRVFAVVVAPLLLLGCASGASRPGDLAPILPASESRLETASPAARDALDEGLRWIAEDAPRTEVCAVPPKQVPTKGAER